MLMQLAARYTARSTNIFMYSILIAPGVRRETSLVSALCTQQHIYMYMKGHHRIANDICALLYIQYIHRFFFFLGLLSDELCSCSHRQIVLPFAFMAGIIAQF